MFSKKNVLISSVSIGAIMLGVNYVGTYILCSQNRDCAHMIASILVILFPVFSVAFLSLVTYFLREEIFQSWIFFAKWFVPLSVILTILTPETTGSAFVPLWGRGAVTLMMSGLFLAISLIIILWKSLGTRLRKV